MAAKKVVLKPGFHRERFQIGEHRETVLKEICPEAREHFPYYFKLPAWNGHRRNDIALLKWRRYVRQRCITDIKFRAAIWEACRRDFMFFCVTFVWIFEPRPLPRRMPFHPFSSQVTLAAWFCEIFGVRDGAVNKTRGIGLTWLVSAFVMWKWFFEPAVTIGMLTETEDKLDSSNPQESNTTLGKLQYIYDNMPTWVRHANPLARTKEDHDFSNRRNAAIVKGFVATKSKLRQLRLTWLFADEFAFYRKQEQSEWMTASSGTCSSRLMGSTWNDFDDMFDYIMYEEESALLKMSAFWWNDYERWQGAYKMKNGRPVFVDEEYKHEPDYPFDEPPLLDEGTLRSPWVDGELSQPGIMDKVKILRDLYGKEVCEHTNNFFIPDVVKAVRTSVAEKEPTSEGLLEVHGDKVYVNPTKKSNIRIWQNVPATNWGPYVAFCDLGGGANKAYSVMAVFDRRGNQVLEYGTNTVDINKFAENVVAVCRWLSGSEADAVILDFDMIGGYGHSFTDALLRLSYANIWENLVMDHKARMKKIRKGDTPTFYGTAIRDRGMANFNALSSAILDLECVIRSEKVLEDMRRCSRDVDDENKPKFPKTSEKYGHGDFLYAAAGAWWRRRSSLDKEATESEREQNRVKYRDRGDKWERQTVWSDQYA